MDTKKIEEAVKMIIEQSVKMRTVRGFKKPRPALQRCTKKSFQD